MSNESISIFAFNFSNLSPSRRLFYCGVPGFCSHEAQTVCPNVTVKSCPHCSMALGITFFVLYAFLFLATVVGNLTIQICFYASSSMRTRIDYMRLSMSFLDLLIGLEICAVVLPNIISTFYKTFDELSTYTYTSIDTAKTRIFGVLVMISFSCSMYHMIVMSTNRLIALQFPVWYRTWDIKWVFLHIGLAWVMSILSVSVAGITHLNFSFSYYQSAFLYLPARMYVSGAPTTGARFSFYLSTVLPYVAVTVILIITIVILCSLRKRQSLLGHSYSQHDDCERRAMVAVGIMYICYSFSIVPMIIIFVLVNSGVLSCATQSLPLMVTTFFAACNSLVNVMIYNFHDERFRRILRELKRKFVITFRQRFMTNTIEKKENIPKRAIEISPL